MSRFDGRITAAGDAELSASELLRVAAATAASQARRQEAIACYLAAGEGWDEALKALDGAFASDAADASGLSGGKAG